MSSEPRRWLVAAITYLAVAVAVLGPSIRPGRTVVPADVLTQVSPYRQLAGAFSAHNPAVSDASSTFYPWYHFVAEGMRSGDVPAWNPTTLNGLRVTPNGQVSVWYPPFWLARWMDTFDAYNLFVLLHLWFGALGIYAFARAIGAGHRSAWLAGLLGFAAAFWVHWSLHLIHLAGMVWLPWVLAATHVLLAAPSRRRVALLAAAIGLWYLGANPQYAYYGSLVMGAYALGVLLLRRRDGEPTRAVVRRGAPFAGAVVLGAALAAPVLWPSHATAGGILRDHEKASEVAGSHLPVRHAVRMIVPDATGNPVDGFIYAANEEQTLDSPALGVTAILLAGAALGAPRRRERTLLAIGAAGVLVLTFTAPLHLLLAHVLPNYDRFRVSARWLGVLPALVLPLAALGIDAVLDGDRRARRALLAAAALAVLLVVGWYGRELFIDRSPHAYLARRAAVGLATVTAVAAAGVLAARRRGRLAVGILIATAVVDIGVQTPRWFPRAEERTAYPDVYVTDIARERGGRLVRAGGGHQRPADYVIPDIPMAYGLEDAQGVTPLFPRSYDRYLRIIDNYEGKAKETNVAPPLFGPGNVNSPLLTALDVRTIVQRAVDPRMSPLFPLVRDGRPAVYARATAGPAVLVPEATPATEDRMWRAVAARGWNPEDTASVLRLPRAVRGGRGTVTPLAQRNDSDRWMVDAPAGGFLRVAGNWDRGWRAEIDGRSVPVYRADGIFRGVVVPPGRHRIEFRFRNPEEREALPFAVVALAVIAALGAVPKRFGRFYSPAAVTKVTNDQGGQVDDDS